MKVKRNGDVVAKLRPDSEIVENVPNGRHEIVASMDWGSSPTLSVVVDDEGVLIELKLSFRNSITKLFRHTDQMIQISARKP